LLIATVVVWFVANNNYRFLNLQVGRHTRNLPERLHKALALADAVAAIPTDHSSQRQNLFPRIPNAIASGAYDPSERAALLRVYLRIAGSDPQPISWCPVANQPCNDLVRIELEGQVLLLDPVRGGAIKRDSTFAAEDDLEGHWLAWPSRLPGAVVWGRDVGLLRSWPSAVDRVDALMAHWLCGGFIIVLVLMHMSRRKQQDSAQSRRGQEGYNDLASALRAGREKSEEGRREEKELERAAQEHDAFLRHLPIEESVGEVVAAAGEGADTETEASEDQLGDLDQRHRDEGDGSDEGHPA